jgi:hypothetical protein
MSGILGHLVSEKQGIKENIEERYFEFYVVGYSQKCQGIHVQANHAMLFSDASKIFNINNKVSLANNLLNQYVWPFGQYSRNITFAFLEPEPTNSYDSNALVVKIYYPLNFDSYIKGESAAFTSYTLGYVPKRINKIILEKIDMIGKGWIKKVRSIHNYKHCVTKVAFPWQIDSSKDELLSNRISAICNSME